jgi:hypothetical protein
MAHRSLPICASSSPLQMQVNALSQVQGETLPDP